MPSKYTHRLFTENGVYHVFNRGVERRVIFIDKSDYKIFLYYMFIYLASPNKIALSYPDLPIRLKTKNLYSKINLLSYCLMPNHFHFLLQQTTKDAITHFMKQITNAYTEYFNRKYEREGGLMQGKYKAIQIENNDLLIHVSRYIHLNPAVSNLCSNIKDYPWSSAKEYIDTFDGICKKELIMDNFTIEKYKKFIEDHVDYARMLDKIKHLKLD